MSACLSYFLTRLINMFKPYDADRSIVNKEIITACMCDAFVVLLVAWGVIMLNKRLAYLRSSSTWPINLCAAEKMHKVDTPSICGSDYRLIIFYQCIHAFQFMDVFADSL